MAPEHQDDGDDHGDERTRHHGIEEICQVVHVGDDEAHRYYGQDKQQRLLQTEPLTADSR